MARTGRATGRPVATELKKHAPNVSATIPPAPFDLGDHGKAFWEQTFKFATWLTPELDSYLVAQAARLSDDMSEARKEILTNGRYILNPNGSRQRSPAVVDLEKLAVTQNLYLTSLGLTPSDRARLGLAAIAVFDELDLLQQRRDERELELKKQR